MSNSSLRSRSSAGVLSARGLRRLACSAAAVLMLIAGARAYTADEQPAASGAPRPLKVLFLGDSNGTHQSADLFTALAPVLARHGIQLTHV